MLEQLKMPIPTQDRGDTGLTGWVQVVLCLGFKVGLLAGGAG